MTKIITAEQEAEITNMLMLNKLKDGVSLSSLKTKLSRESTRFVIDYINGLGKKMGVSYEDDNDGWQESDCDLLIVMLEGKTAEGELPLKHCPKLGSDEALGIFHCFCDMGIIPDEFTTCEYCDRVFDGDYWGERNSSEYYQDYRERFGATRAAIELYQGIGFCDEGCQRQWWCEEMTVEINGVKFYPGASFCGRNFSGFDLSDTGLNEVTMRECDLRGANFAGADLGDSKLAFSNFEGANFTNAMLDNSDFSRANIRDAIFTNADLDGVELSDEQLGSVVIDKKTLLYVGIRYDSDYEGFVCKESNKFPFDIIVGGARTSIGCQHGLTEWWLEDSPDLLILIEQKGITDEQVEFARSKIRLMLQRIAERTDDQMSKEIK